MLSFLEGKKARIAGITIMLTAVCNVVGAWAQGLPIDYQANLLVFMNGLGIFGIRVAMDK